MALRSKTIMLSFVLLIWNTSIISATYLVCHEDAKSDLPILAEFQTKSAMMCIHRCLAHDSCNVANVKEISIYQVECIFAHLEKGDKLNRHLKERKRWFAYKFLQEASEDAEETATTTISTVPTSISTVATASPAPIVCKSGSKFNLKHAKNGQYLGYDTHQERLVTKQNPSTDDEFCELQSTEYLYMVNRKKCLRRISAGAKVEIMLSNDCTSFEAYFWHDGNGIIRYNDTECLHTSSLEQPQLGTKPYLTSQCTYVANSGLLYTKS